MPVPFWAGRYIGLPFSEHGRDRTGLDCWGLVRLVMGEQFGFALPSLAAGYRSTADRKSIAALIAREARLWTPVKAGEEALGDVVVLRLHGAPMHVGLVLGDGQMLHIERGAGSTIARYNSLWWADRISGFYRHAPADNDEDRTNAIPRL